MEEKNQQVIIEDSYFLPTSSSSFPATANVIFSLSFPF